MSGGDRATLDAAVSLFDDAQYLASHELFEELWEETQGPDADFYKGCLQATIALHHFQEGNLEGAAKLYAGHRRFLAAYMPSHLGYDVAALIQDMQSFLRPVLQREAGATAADLPFPLERRPRFQKS